MVRHVVSFGWFVCFSLILELVPSAVAQTAAVAPEIVQYLNTISKYETVQYEVKVFGEAKTVRPKGKREMRGGLALYNRSTVNIDFRNKWYKTIETIYPADSSSYVLRTRAWHKQLLYEYSDVNSPEFANGQVVPATGVIKPSSIEDNQIPSGPRHALGFGISSNLGQEHDLSELILTRHVERLPENGFIIKNIFDWPESAGVTYDIEFHLSTDHDFLPSRYKFWERHSHEKTRLLMEELEIRKFAQSNDLWCPVDIYHINVVQDNKVPHQLLLDPIKLKLNVELGDADFTVNFPENQAYLDLRTNMLFEPGKQGRDISSQLLTNRSIPQTSKQGETTESKIVSWYLRLPIAIAGVILLILAALPYLRRVDRLRHAALLLGAFSCVSGCQENTAYERLFPSGVPIEVYVAGGRELQLERRVSKVSARESVSFHLVNRGETEQEIKLPVLCKKRND